MDFIRWVLNPNSSYYLQNQSMLSLGLIDGLVDTVKSKSIFIVIQRMNF